ncbi:uncharacterized protein [Halyomorpha halys]|uniref:uncharacterized protein isoform X2 n=1 Tax=Halyomorpha halys TaxID=286706 RepID=UPI0006D4E0AD|nr:uncharacterized protein LOC106688786 isoform X2 [Halyomorpha halys]
MDWDNSECLKLIDKYREHRCLWDPRFDQYKNPFKREEAWKTIAWAMNRDVREIKKKMDSLLGSFRRERQRAFGVKKTEPSSDYKTKWFAYQSMKFLLFKYKPRCILQHTHVDFEEPEDVVESQMTIEDHQPSTSSIKKELTPPHWEEYQPTPENKPKKRKIMEDPWVDEAYKILKSGLTYEKDSSAVFGEYVASKHRQYSAFTKSTVEHLINNILYQADIGKYDKPNSQQP